MSTNSDPRQMEIRHLAHRCSEETELFFRHESYDERFCFELFRRALKDRTEQAWDLVYAQYGSLVAGWVKEHSLFPKCGEQVQHFVNEAFARLWKACTGEKFQHFSKLGSLLDYLKACVHSTISDFFHRKVEPFSQGVLVDEIVGEAVSMSAQQTILDQEERQTIWQLIAAELKNDKEAIVIECYFMLALKPREIYAMYTTAFSDQQEVHRVKDNLLQRLKRNKDLETLLKNNP